MGIEELQIILKTFDVLSPVVVSAITKLLHKTNSREELIQASLDLAANTQTILADELAKISDQRI